MSNQTKILWDMSNTIINRYPPDKLGYYVRYFQNLVYLNSNDDADSTTLRALKKAYVKNTGDDCTIKYNGRNFTFETDVVYALDRGEASYFISKSIENGYDLEPATEEDYLSDGEFSFYYW